MGHLTYAGATSYDIDDRMLAHLHAIAASKLRRQEAFLVSWSTDGNVGAGRVSLWLSPAIPLEFRFSGSRAPELSGRWLEAMAELANSAQGLTLMAEQATLAALTRTRR